MADDGNETKDAPAKRSKVPLLAGLVLAVLLGVVGFFATWSGLLPTRSQTDDGQAEAKVAPLPDVTFVSIPPLVISLGPESRSRHLRFTGELEVPSYYGEDVEKVMPRVLDVLNGYLRAVDARQFEEPAALIRLRAQMLRRVQLVVGEGRVRDLLVTEFVLN